MNDPAALFAFEEHHVVLPIVVLTELEAKRHHPNLGWAARTALRSLERLREQHNSLTQRIPLNDVGGTIRVELNHKNDDIVPESLRESSNDHRILTVAASLRAEVDQTCEVVLVTQDLPLRLRAGVLGIAAEEFRHHSSEHLDWDGMVELEVTSGLINELYEERTVLLEAAEKLPVHTGLVLTAGGQSALARVGEDQEVKLIHERELFGVRGRNAEQRIAMDLLSRSEIGIVSLGGPAGTGKSVLALAAGLESVLERNEHKRVLIFRPLYAVGGQELGYLPGNEDEKMRPWTDAVSDALDAIASQHVIDEIQDRGLIEVLPLTHIRGRTLSDTFVIIDEAQNLERGVLLTALSRLGEGSRVVLTHDIAQRDNLHVGRYDGIASVIASLRGHPLFAHITLTRSERSPIAALVSAKLDM